MARFFTWSYAVGADVALGALVVFGFGFTALFSGPVWLTGLAVATLVMVAYAHLLILTGRRFNRYEIMLAVVAGAGVPLVALAVALALAVLLGIDVFV